MGIIIFYFCLIICAVFVSSEKGENVQQWHLNFTEIGDFVEALKQNSGEKVAKSAEEMVAKVGQKLGPHSQNGLQNLLAEVLAKVSAGHGIIVEKCEKRGKHLKSNENNLDIIGAFGTKLTLHELNTLGSKFVKENIYNIYRQNLASKIKVHKWWRRYRYKVKSAVYQHNEEAINEIRTSFFQYYFDAFCNFNNSNKQIQKESPCLSEVVEEMDKMGRGRTAAAAAIVPEITEEEQREFDPFKELPQMTLHILMEQTKNGTPIFVLTERFCCKYRIGHFYDAIGVNHRAVKVYGTEFHFANELGLFIHDKRRIRTNPDRGVKFTQIGITYKTQWEVQQIFDKFSEIFEENGQLKEGEFGVEKYEYFHHNCVHFAREFVEALMEGNKILEDKKWPPKVLRQSHFNQDKYKQFAVCLMGMN